MMHKMPLMANSLLALVFILLTDFGVGAWGRGMVEISQ